MKINTSLSRGQEDFIGYLRQRSYSMHLIGLTYRLGDTLVSVRASGIVTVSTIIEIATVEAVRDQSTQG